MNASARKITHWLIFVICVVVAVYALLPSGPVIRDTPFIREYREFMSCTVPVTQCEDSIDGLLANGVLSADDATYIREHHIQFHGFNPARIGADVAVFETICTNTTPPRRIVGYSDGSTVCDDVLKTP